MRIRALATVAFGTALLLGFAPALEAADKVIKLRFTPKENITQNVPTLDQAHTSAPIEVLPMKDLRKQPDLTVVGENRESKPPRAVHADSSVADFATTVLTKCLSDWGVLSTKGGFVLQGEITNLFVTEENTYATQVSVRFRLTNNAGKVFWEGIASGDAHQWGRSFSDDNYNEQISDALKRTYANLLSNPAFQKAWGGAPAESGTSTTPAALKESILKMMSQGIGADIIVDYVKRAKVEPALTPEDMIEWKNAGIADGVLKAAVAR